jgi:hypothetical protein
MILLDWTRMGKGYCLAGAVAQEGGYRIVRPLLAKDRDAGRKLGWSAYLLDGHARWEVFELIGAEPAKAEPPHVEDLWVRAMRSRKCSAPAGQRRAVLAATMARPGEPPFGAPFGTTRCGAYLSPGTGQRSLATVEVSSSQIGFSILTREGALDHDVRVKLHLPGIGERILAVKDHHLLARVERATTSLEGRAKALNFAVRQMGDRVAVRLGLSRAFDGETARGPGKCWLMADGFFSLTDPQP